MYEYFEGMKDIQHFISNTSSLLVVSTSVYAENMIIYYIFIHFWVHLNNHMLDKEVSYYRK